MPTALITELTGNRTLMNNSLQQWLSLSREELDDIYRQALPGPLPTGDTRGTAIVTGAWLPRTLAHIAKLFAWQGKVFDIFAQDGQSGILINKITPLSLNFIVAKVYRDKSWLDHRDTIVIDYSTTSFFAKLIRDEIRQIEPGLYLGKVWWKKTRILDFALSCPEQREQQFRQSDPLPPAKEPNDTFTDRPMTESENQFHQNQPSVG